MSAHRAPNALRVMLVVGLLAQAMANECDGEQCEHMSNWCPARNCGAYKLDGVEISGASKSEWGGVCRRIKDSQLRSVEPGSNQAYCVSDDISSLGFRCFKGNTWKSDIASFLSYDTDEFDDTAHDLNKTSCENLDVSESESGVIFMSGHCCAGSAVPCQETNAATCHNGFKPLGPDFTNSLISIVLCICAIVHIFSSGMCIVYADRLIDNMDGTEDMSAFDRASFKNVIGSLGAAHGGFAALLIFGAFQDWLYGKRQIGIAAMAWYGILGPMAEAMQHDRKNGCSHYLTVLISASQGECGSGPPKINYLILALLLLLAVGFETDGHELVVGASMIVAGFIASLVITHFVAEPEVKETDNDTDAERSSGGGKRMGGFAQMR
eukprot:CAMPEP_0185180036 /NCGR_PEP_ID=MMETSP1139-20130426/32311_1 /TAXON_ID=298111 /ORGANISM="Pavlova sp., Strain CCMP459" /LENGTH=380 /DNA_ID=CAMNT_0027745871 /DNA_START=1 /DNA_END=1143 /DNA_ORIENTATION=+